MKRWLVISFLGALAVSLGVGFLTRREHPTEDSTRVRGREQSAASDFHGRAPSAVRAPAGLGGKLADLMRGATGEGASAVILARIMSLAEVDPEGAVRLAALLSDSEGREEALHECLAHWLRVDPDAARAWLLDEAHTLPFAIRRSLARDVSDLNPRLGLDMAATLPIGERASSLKDVFSAWAARDPAEAARVGGELGSVGDQAAALDAVGALWGEEDGQAAFEWANGHEAPGSRRAALEAVVGAWARREPEAAALSVSAVPRGDAFRQRLLDDVARGWAEADVEEALQWAKSLSPREEREATATTVLVELAASQPERAAEEALRLSHGEMTALVDKLVVSWAARDKQAATAWTRSHGLALILE